MLSPSLPDTDDDPDAPGLRERQVAVLDRLTVMGMAIAEAIHREVEAGLPGEADPVQRIAALNTAAVAHARAARAVRLALALQARLLGGQGAPGDDPLEPERLIVEWLPPGDAVDGARLDDAADSGGGDHDARTDREHDRERDDLTALLRRPPAELIARICRDLGLDDETAGRFTAAWNEASASVRGAGEKESHHQGHQGHQGKDRGDQPGPGPAVPFHPRW
jgi:hypothetical protein